MFSLEAIRALEREAAQQAQEDRLEPVVPTVEQIDSIGSAHPKIKIHSLGDYTPSGWERTEQQWFVDSSGWGRSDEPALTIDRFREALRTYNKEHPTHGVAVVEEGQFQCYVAAFAPVEENAFSVN